jgi:hypothetical protein
MRPLASSLSLELLAPLGGRGREEEGTALPFLSIKGEKHLLHESDLRSVSHPKCAFWVRIRT